MARALSLVVVVTSCLILGAPPSGARAQAAGPNDLLAAIEQTQGALEDVTDETLALVSPPNPPSGDGSGGGGGGERGSVEPPPPNPESTPAPLTPVPSPDDPPQGADGAAPAAPVGTGAPQDRRRGRAADREGGGRDRVGAGEPARAPPRNRDSGSSRDDKPTAFERIVSVVPMPIKVALAVLVLLVLGSLLTTRHTRRKLAHAERRAATDPLTGLPNRITAEEALERLLAHGRRTGRPVAAALFDLDHFKAVNDTFGHATGDDALRVIASAARTRVRGGDHVARFGGEEFLLLLPDTDRDGAVTIAESLRSAIAKLEVEGPGSVTASFGVASMPADATSSADLLATADRALYAAKDAGRNRVEAAGPPTVALEPVA